MTVHHYYDSCDVTRVSWARRFLTDRAVDFPTIRRVVPGGGGVIGGVPGWAVAFAGPVGQVYLVRLGLVPRENPR